MNICEKTTFVWIFSMVVLSSFELFASVESLKGDNSNFNFRPTVLSTATGYGKRSPFALLFHIKHHHGKQPATLIFKKITKKNLYWILRELNQQKSSTDTFDKLLNV